MKFTIGTVSNYQEYENDLNLIKSSLLYADEIELIGLTEYTMFKYLPELLDSKKDIEQLVAGLLPFMQSVNVPGKEGTIQQLEYMQSQLAFLAPILQKKKRRTKADFQAQFKINQLKSEFLEVLSGSVRDLVDHPLSKELESLVKNNIVCIYDYGFQGMNLNEMTGGYVGSLLNAIYAENTFPLFDEKSTDFIGSIADTKLLDIGKVKAEVIRHAGVATNILMTLPTLNTASYDELLDLKKQNALPLARFRKAIYGFSEKITSLPWDDDFQYECIKLYDTEVVPQVAEINELFTETSTLKNFGKKVLADEEIRKKSGFVAGGLATAITTSNSLTGLLHNLLLAMSLAVFSAEAAAGFLKVINLGVQAYSETKEAKAKGTENVMYYYYLASKL